MTTLLPVIAVALSVGLVAAVAGLAWWRIDHLERRLRVSESRRQSAVDRAETAETHAREWAAIADERAADLVDHMARCLGELVHHDSGVMR